MRWRRIGLVNIVPVVFLFMVALVFGFRPHSLSEEGRNIEFDGLERGDNVFWPDWEEGGEDGAPTSLIIQ
jgi:hypothetical protein